MIITIFLTPANKKFLQKRYNFIEQMQVLDESPVGIMISEILKPKQRKYELETYVNMVQCDFKLPEDTGRLHLVHIDRKSTYVFNRFVDDLMRLEFMAHMNALTEYGSLDINESVYHFIDKYDFQDDEITFDALRRYFTRQQKKADQLPLSA